MPDHNYLSIVTTLILVALGIIGFLLRGWVKHVNENIGEIWQRITKIADRQEQLREELPDKYLKVGGPGYKALADGIHRIENNFDRFAKDCKDGNCGAKRGG